RWCAVTPHAVLPDSRAGQRGVRVCGTPRQATDMPDQRQSARPDPDALLALVEQGGRGRLTLFLGAAPGVGKTYAMLAGAGRLKAEGTDIVVGLVETHGRGETAALLDGLEVLSRRSIEYQGHTIEEFDLDAALKRPPQIIIVDELAHANAPA